MTDLANIAPGEKVTTCDGQGLKQLAWAALQWLEQNVERVNALNVFPVPDGDTGTNMLLTMRSAYREIENSQDTHVGTVIRDLSNGALMGSRGNSGVILSQLWRGFARALEDHDQMGVGEFVAGMQEATRLAYDAVQSPVEGTMLTVSREAAELAQAKVDQTDDLHEMLRWVVDECHASVERTPELLPVLKQAGVVDSGGVGLTYVFEGMLRYMEGKPVAADEAHNEHTDEQGAPEYDPEFPYDVQFLIKGDNLDVDTIRREIEAMGDSGVIVGEPHMVKVHIHVANPGEPIGYAAERGSLLDVVVENMYEQYLEFVKREGGVDTTTLDDLGDVEPPTIEEGQIATVVVAPGEGFRRIFYSLGAGHVIAGGQTMNPSTRDILDAIDDLPTDKIIILPNNKNIYMASEQAMEKSEKDVRVIKCRTVPQGISAQLSLLDPFGTLDETAEAMQEAVEYVETGEVTTAVRDVEIDGVTVAEGQIIGLHNGKLRVAGEDIETVINHLLEEMEADDLELITLYYGQDVEPNEAELLAASLRKTYTDHEIEIQPGGQPHYFYVISAE